MQKEKILGSVLTAMFSIAAFAQSDNGFTEQSGHQAIVAFSSGNFTVLCVVLVVVILIAIGIVVVWRLLKEKIQEGINLLSDLKNQILKPTATDPILQQIQDNVIYIKASLGSDNIKIALEEYFNETNEIGANLNQLLVIAPELKTMNEQMQKLLDEKPDLVNLSIDNAVELLKQCNSEGISSVEQIKEMSAITQQCKAAQFTSLAEIIESKKYYDARSAHAATQEETEKQISDLQSEKAKIAQDFSILQQKQMSIAEESIRLKQANEALASKEKELEQNLEHANAEKDRLDQILSSLCPETINADLLLDLLQNSTPELRSETLALIVQLYWFSQLSRTAPAKIKAAFAKFDETLYELFTEEQELLQTIRQSIQEFVNTEIFKDTSYEISWPALNSSASEHEDYYNRENDEGNRICKVRSAVIMNSGNIESVARIYTSL